MRYLQQLFFLLCLMYAHTVSSQTFITEVTCAIAGESPDSNDLRSIAEKLISIKEQELLDSIALNKSIEALSLCRLFSNISVKQSQGRLEFELIPAEYVRDIIIRREHPLFEDDVEKSMTSRPGDIFSDDLLSRQDSVVEALYRREGFICPQVDVSSRKHRSENGHVLLVDIKSGPYFRLQSIQIKGNKTIPNAALKGRMNVWRASLVPGSAGRFLAVSLRKDIKVLTAYYQSKGFADVELSDSLITDSLNRSVELILTINEGDRYKVTLPPFRERGMPKRVLRRDITLFKTDNRNNTGLRKSVAAIEDRYQSAGFLEANVQASDTVIVKRNFTRRIIGILINRGVRTTVSSISINGAGTLGEEVVRSQMLHVDKGSDKKRAFDPKKLEEDVFAIQMMYQTHGFLKATVSSSITKNDNSVALFIDIVEGVRTAVTMDTTDRTGNDIKKAVIISSGEAYRYDRIKRSAQSLQAIIAEQGYPHVSVRPVVTMNSDSSLADVSFSIDKGPRVIMGEIRHTGVFHTRATVMTKALKIEQGSPLSLKKIIDTQRALRDLGPFTSVRFVTIGLKEKRDTVHLFTDITERRPWYGTVGGGYQSNTGLMVTVKTGNRNVLGFNKDAWISGEISQAGQKGSIGFIEPRLFGTLIRTQVDMYGERGSELNMPWKKTEYGISTSLIASPIKKTTLGVTTGYKRRRLSSDNGAHVSDTVKITDKNRPRNVVVITPSVTFDRRDSFTRPRKGILLSTSVDVSKSLDISLDDFLTFRAEARGYITPFLALTFAGIVRGEHHYLYGTSSIPDDQKFYLGGTQDLRGFNGNMFYRDTSGRTSMLFSSIEARISIGFNIELAAFADVGRLENDLKSMKASQFRISAGTGIRYITPIGPIGLLYGWKLYRKKNEEPGAFHFSIGYTF